MAVTVEGVLRFSSSIVHLPTFPLFCAYLVMIWLIPLWIRNTKPLQFRSVLIYFNFAVTVVSALTMLGFAYGLWEAGSLFSRETNTILQHSYNMYFLSKIFELLDTVFMVVRHKTRQISFLQVFHHSSMLILSDYGRSLTPWPAIVPFVCINSFVHVVLYLYYGLTALRPDNPPTWKKLVTQVQLLQFFVLFIHALYGWMYHGFCIYSILYGCAMITLFSNFYYKAYIKKRAHKPQQNGKADMMVAQNGKAD